MARFASVLSHRVARNRFARFALWPSTGPRLSFVFVLLYAGIFPVFFPLLTWYANPHTSFASITGRNYFAAIGLALVSIVLILLNRQMWTVAQNRAARSVAITILAGWLGASACLLLTYPGQSTDIADYSFRAHMLVHLGKNPLTTPPSAVIPFDSYPYLSWYRVVDPYGPVWHWLAGGLHALVGDDVLANFLAFKFLAIIATGASGVFIYAILRQIASSYAVAGLALWLWNPLVLNEGALNGHNDLVMVAIMLAGLWLMLGRHATVGVVTLVVAGLVKVSAWILLPVVFVWLLRQRGWRHGLAVIALASCAGGLLVFLAYAPFGGWALLPEMLKDRSWWPTGTWTAAAFYALRDGLHWPHDTVVGWVIGSVTLLFGIIAMILMVKIRDLRACAWSVVLAYLLVASHWFQPWYATWLVALAAIAIDRRLVTYTIVFTFFMLLHPIVAQYVASQVNLPPGGNDLIMAAATLLVPQILALRLIVMSKKLGLKHDLVVT